MSTEQTKLNTQEENFFSSADSEAQRFEKVQGSKNSHATLDGVMDNSQSMDENTAEGRKKKKEHEKELEAALLHWSDEAYKHFQDMFNDIQDDIDAYKASKAREKQISDAMKNQDFATLRALYGEHYGQDTTGWSNAQLIEYGKQRVGEENLTQDTLEASIKQKFEDVEAEKAKYGGNIPPHVEKQLFKDMDNLEAQAAEAGLDFDEARYSVNLNSRMENGKAYAAYNILNDQTDEVDNRDLLEKNVNSLSATYNAAAIGEPIVDPLANMNDIEEDNEIKQPQSAPDPLAGMRLG